MRLYIQPAPYESLHCWTHGLDFERPGQQRDGSGLVIEAESASDAVEFVRLFGEARCWKARQHDPRDANLERPCRFVFELVAAR